MGPRSLGQLTENLKGSAGEVVLRGWRAVCAVIVGGTAQDASQDATLWWTNIAMENGHL